MDSRWWMVPAIVIPATVAVPAMATEYLSVEEAQALTFPDATSFVKLEVNMTPAQRKAIARASGVRLRFDQQPVWQAKSEGKHIGWVVVDEVLGKHEYITYAVALDPHGTVIRVEVLTYRETHGGEVRNPLWLDRFVGASHNDELTLGGAIANISGATLSCKHLTEGVRRILAIHEIVLATGAADSAR